MQTGYGAYGQTHGQNLTGRRLEGEAFMKAARLLSQAQGFMENKRLLGEALQYTQKLWTIVQADLKSENNKMDKNLKAQLLSLSLFVDEQCLLAIKKPHPQVLQGLIEVNRNVASGLLS
ncbi:MAG: flagellar protein FlaF [Methylocystaceae bacterium]|nr:flagellar protein FlaF [Methylocystaceae bacterium]